MQFLLEVAILECSFLKHSHRILRVNKKNTVVGNFVFCYKCCGFSHALLVFLHTWIHLLANYRPKMHRTFN